jgi:hypothetical protein
MPSMSAHPDFRATVSIPSSPALAELLCVCPSCLGTSWDIGLEQCPDCDVELLIRSPISARRRPVATALRLDCA